MTKVVWFLTICKQLWDRTYRRDGILPANRHVLWTD